MARDGTERPVVRGKRPSGSGGARSGREKKRNARAKGHERSTSGEKARKRDGALAEPAAREGGGKREKRERKKQER